MLMAVTWSQTTFLVFQHPILQVGDAIGFDLDCAQRGMKVFMADASVNGLPSENPSLAFTKKFLGCWDDQDNTTLI